MIDLGHRVPVYLARDPIDFRKQIDGLAVHVQEALLLDPFSPSLFVYRNKSGDKVKVLFWHGNGFCLLYKRLARRRFHWPQVSEQTYRCTVRELQWLLDGLDLGAMQAKAVVEYSRV